MYQTHCQLRNKVKGQDQGLSDPRMVHDTLQPKDAYTH